MYDVLTSSNQSGGGFQIPTTPNSLLFDRRWRPGLHGERIRGACADPRQLRVFFRQSIRLDHGSEHATGLVTGKVLATSPNGTFAVFADNVSTPNQVYPHKHSDNVAIFYSTQHQQCDRRGIFARWIKSLHSGRWWQYVLRLLADAISAAADQVACAGDGNRFQFDGKFCFTFRGHFPFHKFIDLQHLQQFPCNFTARNHCFPPPPNS